jgi:hypothetical protein
VFKGKEYACFLVIQNHPYISFKHVMTIILYHDGHYPMLFL